MRLRDYDGAVDALISKKKEYVPDRTMLHVSAG